MMLGFSPVLSVFWATVVSFVTSFLRRDTALLPYDLFDGKGSIVRKLFQSPFVKAMEGGSIGVLNVAATCAGAGIIVGVVTLTGLGLKFSSIVIDYAGGSPAADRDLHVADGVDRRTRGAGDRLLHHLRGDRGAGADQARRARLRRAHVHLLLRGAVGGLAADGALAVRGRGHHGRRSVHDDAAIWKYTVPAFLVPFMFVLDPSGQGLLLMGSTKALANANWWSIAEVTLSAAVGIAALAAGFQGWALKRATAIERIMLLVAGFALVYPTALADAIGFGLVLAALASQYFRKELQLA